MKRILEVLLITAAFFIITTAFLIVDKHSSQLCGYTEAFTQQANDMR